jgi:hypothetical protein
MYHDDPTRDAAGWLSEHAEEIAQSSSTHPGFQQAHTSLSIIPQPAQRLNEELKSINWSNQEVDIRDEESAVRIPEHIACVVRKKKVGRVYLWLARQTDPSKWSRTSPRLSWTAVSELRKQSLALFQRQRGDGDGGNC